MEQMECIKRLVSFFSFYSNFLNNYNHSQKFHFYSPKYRILDNINRPNIFLLESMKNENAVYWWKYSIRMVIKKQKYLKGR